MSFLSKSREVVNFAEVLLFHGMENYTCVNSESIVKETNLKTICLTIQKTVQL